MRTYGAIGVCFDRGHQQEHEIVFITDGTRVYAYGDEECAGVIQHSPTKFFVVCGQPVYPGKQPCLGEVRFDTDDTPPVGAGWCEFDNQEQLLDLYGFVPDQVD